MLKSKKMTVDSDSEEDYFPDFMDVWRTNLQQLDGLFDTHVGSNIMVNTIGPTQLKIKVRDDTWLRNMLGYVTPDSKFFRRMEDILPSSCCPTYDEMIRFQLFDQNVLLSIPHLVPFAVLRMPNYTRFAKSTLFNRMYAMITDKPSKSRINKQNRGDTHWIIDGLLNDVGSKMLIADSLFNIDFGTRVHFSTFFIFNVNGVWNVYFTDPNFEHQDTNTAANEDVCRSSLMSKYKHTVDTLAILKKMFRNHRTSFGCFPGLSINRLTEEEDVQVSHGICFAQTHMHKFTWNAFCCRKINLPKHLQYNGESVDQAFMKYRNVCTYIHRSNLLGSLFNSFVDFIKNPGEYYVDLDPTYYLRWMKHPDAVQAYNYIYAQRRKRRQRRSRKSRKKSVTKSKRRKRSRGRQH